MNPNYPTLRTVSETTYFFLSAMCTTDFEWVMQNIYHATDYQKYGQEDFTKIIPHNITIPPVQDTPVPGMGNRITKHPYVIISHYDTTDLHEIVCHTFYHTFNELENMHNDENECSKRDYLREESILKKHNII